jgi:hypothetical protein
MQNNAQPTSTTLRPSKCAGFAHDAATLGTGIQLITHHCAAMGRVQLGQELWRRLVGVPHKQLQYTQSTHPA